MNPYGEAIINNMTASINFTCVDTKFTITGSPSQIDTLAGMLQGIVPMSDVFVAFQNESMNVLMGLSRVFELCITVV